MDMKTTEITEININSLFEKIASVIEEARRRASTAINLSEVYAKFNVGRYIVEDEQGGKERAAYGKQVLEQLSKKIEERFGEGWSVDTLKRCRKFYSIYSTPAIGATVLLQLRHHKAHRRRVIRVSETFERKLKQRGRWPVPAAAGCCAAKVHWTVCLSLATL